ncbi:hypothetical protein FRC09_000224 [Ceratobasidium sp. 395]|nr:hypothetical protein FRC09_000224 [Ceratobasidium sp. 395]
MSESADSRFSPASIVCKNAEIFKLWANEVQCSPLPERLAIVDPEALPEPLVTMVKESKRIPKWVFDEESKYYCHFKLRYPIEMDYFDLRRNEAREESSDPTAADLLVDAFPYILSISEQHRDLWEPGNALFMNEPNLRQPIDSLTAHTWRSKPGSRERFKSRLECKLKLLSTEAVKIQDCIADSVAFLYSPSLPIQMFSPQLRNGLACTSIEPQFLELVHWVTEFKLVDLDGVRRQTCYGMVSSLWQRRVLGRMNDFVFGTAHAATSMTVYAARWEPVESMEQPTEPGNVSSPNVAAGANKTTSDEPGLSKSASPIGSRSKSGLGEKNVATSSTINSQAGDSRERHQIKIYKIGEYTTLDTLQMVEYYLLLRASFGVANGYLDEIISDPGLAAKIEARATAFGWPFPPKPNPKSHANSSRQDMQFISGELDASDSCQVPLVADPEEEATWSKEWEEQARRAVDEFGPGSLDELVSVTPDYNDRLSHYLNHIG